MKKLSGVVALLLSLVLLAPAVWAAPDVPESHGFYEEITYLTELGVLGGYPDGTVRPESVVTRAEAAIMIGRLKELDGTQRATSFSDVTQKQAASGFIAAAQEAGFITGYPDGTFRPYESITRGDMAIILSRIFVTPITLGVGFSDVSVNMRAYEPIAQVLAANITIGYPDNTFRPHEFVTRAQFSAFLARGLEPKFKNDAVIENSFMKDKTKTYSYRYVDGNVLTHTFNFVEQRFEQPIGFAWTVTDSFERFQYDYVEGESHNGYLIGYPYSESYLNLVYPPEVGKTFNTDSFFVPESTITAVGVTVETPYRTFTDAVEVTAAIDDEFYDSGYKYYMVEGFGEVKFVNRHGVTLYELVDVQ
ncbi:S-layer homology domain-containing protein [Planococcus salinus]|uniref:S-layer homology domain-containing protein n=1 Tax=Planococcus salinus TaxID=1848460 RepID=A0A3M8P7J0_9BACL|nr:S-layer homology domain-containing protein [Planococcus salinus]RNF39646.1 S-layer homology domain-containing protein [Planococcus salinus]